ncbi:MAG: hypothetical protein NC230_08965 [Bacteroides sp.]|nr:hypothetical protein [Bacteroides sp.]MCM1414228.1 hypothetical protein [Bacteroides sp.]
MTNVANKIAIAALMSLTSLSIAAQDLHKEVEIQYQETPTLRPLSKLPLDPTIVINREQTRPMNYSTASPAVTLPSAITRLEPVGYADTIYTSPCRGYAALGFMPTFNLAASAGYKIFDNDHTRLNAWLQYDGTAYRGKSNIAEGSEPFSTYLRRNTATIGANLHQAVGHESFIDAGIDYTFARFNVPLLGNTLTTPWGAEIPMGYDSYYQNVHRFNLSALWTMRHRDLNFGIGAAYSRFAPVNSPAIECTNPEFNNDLRPDPSRENVFRVNAFATTRQENEHAAGILLDFSYQNFTNSAAFGDQIPLPLLTQYGSVHHSMLSVKPFYKFRIDNFLIDLGVKLDVTFNAGKTFHIAPDAQATWLPGDFVKVYIRATGGQHRNTLASLYDINPYALPVNAWRNSQLAADLEAGVTVGAWKGLFAEISFNYAIANDWLMPAITGLYSDFTPINLKGYRLRGAIGYSYRDIASIKASYEMMPQKVDRGYYPEADRAKQVVSLDLEVHPISDLDFNIGWQYRGHRATTVLFNDGALTAPALTPLRSVNNLHAGATYRITPQWSVFLQGENLLNRHHYLVGGLPAQGITGLAGATYKF